MQAYSNPKRESDPHSLPDIEVFHHEHAKRERCALNAGHKAELYGECIVDEEGDCLGTGWYWQSCFPGCLPDSEPMGPFKTEAEALADARDGMEDETEDEPTYEVFVRDWWRMERGQRVPNPGADEEQLATGLSYSEAREMCEEYNSSHEPGELSRKAEFRSEN